ncbi:response regulator [Oceanithermus sp.]
MESNNALALIISPNPALKAYLELVFEEFGLAPHTEPTLLKGLHYLKEHTPRIIVLDELHEKGLDSAGFVWRIKRIKRLRRAPTIQIVHGSNERERITMEISGADHIVELPIKDRRFRRMVEELLSISR